MENISSSIVDAPLAGKLPLRHRGRFDPEPGAMEAPLSTDQIADAIRRWQAAESRLYPVIMVRPDLYEAVIATVRETVNSLQDIGDVEALVSVEAETPASVLRALARLGLPAAELNVALIAAASLSMRAAEIGSATARAQRTALIAAGRALDEVWVLLNETAKRDSHAPPYPPYHRLEMRLADGLGLHLYVELDPSTATPVYGLETVQLDLMTGEWTGDAGEAVTARYDHPQQWDTQALELRRPCAPDFAGGRAESS